MDEQDWLAKQFEEYRSHLRAVAYRMLGSLSEVDDAVQEAWLRLSRSETSGIENLGGWLTTVVGRVCLAWIIHERSGGLWFARLKTDENAPRGSLTDCTLNPITQNHLSLIHQRKSAS